MLFGRKKQEVKDDFNDLHQSYGRCMNNGKFIERFYEIFLASHPEVEMAFAGTDFDRQRRLLRRTLTSSIMYAAGSKGVKMEVGKMAEIHSRRGRAPVSPHLYKYWLDSLMTTIREFDPELTPQLEARWKKAMRCVTDDFAAVY